MLLALLRTRVARGAAKADGLRAELRAKSAVAKAARQAEVDDFDLPRVRVCLRPGTRFLPSRRHDHQVRRLEIPMHDLLLMDRAETARNLRGKAKGQRGRQRPARLQPIRERLPGDKFHRVEKISRCRAEKHHAGHVGMAHARGRARLALEERLRLRVIHPPRRDHLQGHIDAQLFVVRLVGHAHGAAAQFPDRSVRPAEDAVMREH